MWFPVVYLKAPVPVLLWRIGQPATVIEFPIQVVTKAARSVNIMPYVAPLGRPNADHLVKRTTSSKGAYSMAWILLFIAGLLEMVWALLLKQSEGFTRPVPTVGFFISLLFSMFLLAQALRTLPVGSAYAVWTGIGAAGTAIVGMLWLGESRDIVKLVSLVMLIAGIIGLRLTSAH